MKLLRVAAALLSVGVAFFSPANANANANVATDDPRLLRHVRRILTTQADDQAACDAAFNNNPLKSYLTALPTDAGLRNCAASNINVLAAPLTANGAKCSLTSLVTLFSGSDPGMAVLTEFFNALVAGLSSASGSTDANTNTDVSALLASWTSTNTKNEAFCKVMNAQIGPCAEALLPAFVAILDSKGQCCSQLIELYELLKLIVPEGKTLDQTLVAIVNGLHVSMCTTTADGFCGQSLLGYLASVVEATSSSSLLVPIVFDMGLPLFALPDGSEACSALDATSFTSRVSSKEVAYTDLSCCAVGYTTLMKSVDDVVKHFTGDSFADTLNVIAGLQDASSNKFVSPYDIISACKFTQKTCTKPTFTLTAKAGSLNVTQNSPKNAKPKQIQCTQVELCDQDKVCSSVCQEGTVKIAPWVARAISYQRNLSYEQSLCFAQLPGTHNTGTTLARGWGNRDQLMNKVLDPANAGSYMRTANQFLTVTDQLNLGARFVEIDVHYFGKKIRDGHCSNINFDVLQDVGAALVRTIKALLDVETVEWQPSLMGCLPSLGGIKAANTRAHADTVKEIAAWVKANPNDLVIVYLDVGSEVKTVDKYDEMLKLHTAAFGDQLFTPADLVKAGGSWKSFTLSSLVEQGKRVFIVANEASDAAFEMRKLCDGFSNVPGGKTGGGAGTIWGKKTNTGAIVRAYSSVLHYATMSEDELGGSTTVGTASEPAIVEASTLPAFVNAGVNILAPDGLDGAVMQGMVWSWAAKEPSRGDTAVEISAKDGRWYGVEDASSIKNVACVSDSNRLSWEIVSQGSSCPSGFVAGAPKLAIENVALTTALRATGAEATAKLEVDLTNFPVISAEEEAAFDDASSNGGAPGPAPSNGVDQLSTSVVVGLVAALALIAMQ